MKLILTVLFTDEYESFRIPFSVNKKGIFSVT